MKAVFTPTKGMTPVDTSYCPGCTHGIAHRIIMEVLDEMDLDDPGKVIGRLLRSTASVSGIALLARCIL